MKTPLLAVLLFCSFVSISHAKEIDLIEGAASGLLDHWNSKSQTFFGSGGYGVIGNWLIGGEGFGVIDETIAHSNLRGYGLLKAGYVGYSDNDTRLFSMLGVGGGELDLRKDSEKSTDSILVDVSVGLLFAKVSKKTTLAVNLGYLHSIGWHFEKQDVEISGFYLNVNLGAD